MKIINDIIKISLGHNILNIISVLFISKIQFDDDISDEIMNIDFISDDTNYKEEEEFEKSEKH